MSDQNKDTPPEDKDKSKAALCKKWEIDNPDDLDPKGAKCIVCGKPFVKGEEQHQQTAAVGDISSIGRLGGSMLTKPICHECYHAEVGKRREAIEKAQKSTPQ